ncbi:MAG: ROK family protein, partial [Catalinimonas sp.]
METFWGIDLGGTKVEGVVLSDEVEPRVLGRLRVPTEANKGYEHILRQIDRLVLNLIRETKQTPTAVGIGTPGALDPHTQTLKNSNTTVLNGKSFRADLSRTLGVPVVIANDANCFALAEARLGAAAAHKGYKETVFGMILGTGVGGGVVIGGQLIQGHHGIAGEWGHNVLDASGGPCYCGKVGCIETIISGKALERYYAELSGKTVPLPEIYQRFHRRVDPYATATIQRLVQFFGKAASQIINVFDPDVIVVGGGVGNIDMLYTDGVAEVAKYVFNDRLDTAF